MDLEFLKAELAKVRIRQKRGPLPKEIWLDAVKIAKEEGVGKVAKELGLNTVRLRHWAKHFQIDLAAPKIKKSKESIKIVKVAAVKLNNNNNGNIDFNNRKTIDVSFAGLTISMYEACDENQIATVLKVVGGVS